MRRLLVSALLGLAVIMASPSGSAPATRSKFPRPVRRGAGPALTASPGRGVRALRRRSARGRLGALSSQAPPSAEMLPDNAAAEPMACRRRRGGARQPGNHQQPDDRRRRGRPRQADRPLPRRAPGRAAVQRGSRRRRGRAAAGSPTASTSIAARANAASWSDEMLVFGDRILVTAYNYREGASEITVIRMDRQGRLTREGRFLLSSNDYYSTENYATRLVGDNLVFYAPQALTAGGPEGRFAWPRIRRAERDGEADAGEALIGPTASTRRRARSSTRVLHTLSVCPLRGAMAAGPPPSSARRCANSTSRRPTPSCGSARPTACPGVSIMPTGAGRIARATRLGRAAPTRPPCLPAPARRRPGRRGRGRRRTDRQFAFDRRDGRFRALLARARRRDAASPARLRPARLARHPARRLRRHGPPRLRDGYAALPPIAAGGARISLRRPLAGLWRPHRASDCPLERRRRACRLDA